MIEIHNDTKDCVLCGDQLKKLNDRVDALCDYCGKNATVSYQCGNMHLICDNCLKMDVYEYIKTACLKYKGTDPIELAVHIMNSPQIKMHGPEHHFIVPAVMLRVLHNTGKINTDINYLLDLAGKRAIGESPQHCDFHAGNCGAAIGTGIFLSIFQDRDIFSEDMWSDTNKIVSFAMKTVLESHGPRCCKRDTYLSIESAVDYINEHFAINLPISEAKCTFSLRNKTCGREDCNYYNMGLSLV